jgi:hypothetical protein
MVLVDRLASHQPQLMRAPATLQVCVFMCLYMVLNIYAAAYTCLWCCKDL